jgi:peptide/nickel transport system permease protein
MTEAVQTPLGTAKRRRTAAELRREKLHMMTRTLTLAWHAYARDKAAVGALVFMVIVVLLTILAPYISPHDPTEAVAPRGALPGTEGVILGADLDGRDILSRLLWGGRIALLVGVVPTLAATLFAILLGLIAGYIGGWLDQVIMRILDVFFAFPLVLLAIVIAGILNPGVGTLILSIAIALIPYITRLVRTTTISVKQQPYIEAARAGGASTAAILTRYVLPNMLAPVIVYSTTLIGLMMVVGSGLSFLGLGIQPPDADWGTMVSEGRAVLKKAPHATAFPGFVIVVVSLAFSFIGDGLRDALDPRARVR